MSINPARACIQNKLALYRNKIVRDLLWSLCTPPLIAGNSDSGYWVNDDWFNELILELLEPLTALDEDPSALFNKIQRDKDRRLGHIYETLLAHAFSISHRFKLLARNVIIRDKGRTLGEMDLLIRDTREKKTIHLEVAVKFYLGIETHPNELEWIGPNPRDRLIEKKLGLEKQLELSRSPAALAWLTEQGITIDDRCSIMKGRLFHPLGGDPKPAPAWINPNHPGSWWADTDSFLHHHSTDDLLWMIVDKSDWLSPLTPNDTTHPVSPEELMAMLTRDGLINRVFNQPLCIAGLNDGYERVRGFLVPKSWIDAVDATQKTINTI